MTVSQQEGQVSEENSLRPLALLTTRVPGRWMKHHEHRSPVLKKRGEDLIKTTKLLGLHLHDRNGGKL